MVELRTGDLDNAVMGLIEFEVENNRWWTKRQKERKMED